ncbi:hypothetical protein PHMEG_0009689 [Phytophthora megakarya]|uniref:Transposase n=1 Tax=Phytophthora megakarya TaxID=4795 RepID=A0A225WFV3_9STRA|nr:hypothetical protein PHMEG_0009689 [Phytophthora megakarya]
MLRPIELMWAQVKGPIAHFPTTNTTDTVARVKAELAACEGQWLDLDRGHSFEHPLSVTIWYDSEN